MPSLHELRPYCGPLMEKKCANKKLLFKKKKQLMPESYLLDRAIYIVFDDEH